MKQTVLGLIASCLLLCGIIGAAPSATISINVVAGSYPGATSNAQMIAAIQSDGATHAWPLTDASATGTVLADAIGNDNLSIGAAGGTLSSSFQIVNGDQYSASAWFESGFNTSVSSDISLPSSSAWTIGFTFIPAVLSGTQNLWSTGNPASSGSGVAAYVNANGTVSAKFGSNTALTTSSAVTAIPTLTAKTPGNFVVVSWNGSNTASLSLNGATPITETISPYSNGSTFSIIKNLAGGLSTLNGYAQDVFYVPGAALTGSQIAALDALEEGAELQSQTQVGTTTSPAAQLADSLAFDTEYVGYNSGVETYGPESSLANVESNPATKALQFLGGALSLRDGQHVSGTNPTNYTYLCQMPQPILHSLGFNFTKNSYAVQNITGIGSYGPESVQGVGTYTKAAVTPGTTTIKVNSLTYTTYATSASGTARTFTAGDPILLDVYGNYGTLTNVTETGTIASVNASASPPTITLTASVAHAHVKGVLVNAYGTSACTSGCLSDHDAAPVPLSISQVTGYWDDSYTNSQCYPYFSEPANEPDGGSAKNGVLPPLQLTDPSSETQQPWYATLSIKQMETMLAARASNSKYKNIKIISVGLSSSGNYTKAAQAGYDLSTESPTGVPVLPIPLDFAAEHTGYFSVAPELGQGVLAHLAGPYSLASNGTVVFSQAQSPLWWTEFGHSNISAYYASGNSASSDLAGHYWPRSLLANQAAGIRRTYHDFISDHTSGGGCNTTYANLASGAHFCDNGWLDVQGNMQVGAYAVANMLDLLSDQGSSANPGCNPLTFNPSQLQFSLSGATNTSTDKIVPYAFRKCDGTSWLVLVHATEEATSHATGSTGYPQGGNSLNRAPFESVTVTLAAPSTSYDTVTIFQNDEFCNLKRTQGPLPQGAPFAVYPAGVTGANADCYQYWPSGSLVPGAIGTLPNPSTHPTVTSSGSGPNLTKSFSVNVNGAPLIVELSNGAPVPIPTATPLAPNAVATPGGGLTYPDPSPLAATPAPVFKPPSGG